MLVVDFPIAAEEEPEDAAQRQRQKLAGTGLTSDEEDELPAAGSGYESDDNQAEERQQSAEPLTGLSCIHNCVLHTQLRLAYTTATTVPDAAVLDC